MIFLLKYDDMLIMYEVWGWLNLDIRKIIKVFTKTSLMICMCGLGVTFAFATNGEIAYIQKGVSLIGLDFIKNVSIVEYDISDNIIDTYSDEDDYEEDRIDLVLVNRENKLNERYVPSNLVQADIQFEGVNNMVALEMKSDLENMFNDAKLDGIDLVAVSGYRSYAYQESLYNMSLVEESGYNSDYVALPGYSEHQTGLAIDVLSRDYMFLNEGFKYTDAYKWIKENAHKYGFIVRYPEGKEDITGYPFEPWHLRYVGIKNAKNIIKRDCTLEEYLK